MHAVVMFYGIKDGVDRFIEELQNTKLPMKFHKENGEQLETLMQIQVRQLPFGLYEIVFPKEYADPILTSLRFNIPTPYNLAQEIQIFRIKIKPMDYLKKFLKIEDIPEFKTDRKIPFLFLTDYVAIIPIGVRYDPETTQPDGWIHEAI